MTRVLVWAFVCKGKWVSISKYIMHCSLRRTSSCPQATDLCICRVFNGITSKESIGDIPSAMVPMVRRPITNFATAFKSSARSYTGSDPIGLELAGALKNVYAIATGLADGLGFENNTRAGWVIPLFESDAY